MSIFEPSSSRWTGRILSVLRIVAGLIYVSSGTMKLFGTPPMPAGAPPIEPLSLFWFAGMLDTFGGALIVLGLFTRPVAFLLAGEMAVAYFKAHFPLSPWPTVNNGIPAVLYCFMYLYYMFAGGGPWSLDALIARSKGAWAGEAARPTVRVSAEPRYG